MEDLQDKSPEFVEKYARANPVPDARAKVPLLQVGDDIFLTESSVVTEYVAELFDAPLIPSAPADRAVVRLFTELCGGAFAYFPSLRATADDEQAKALATLKEGLVGADAFLRHHAKPTGPFLLGDRFTTAECSVAPFVQRSCTVLPAFAKPDPLTLCDELGLDQLKGWIEAVLARPSVVATGVPAQDMIKSTSNMLERFKAMQS